MTEKRICKTVHQYNKVRVQKDDMRKLQEIADDYTCIKNYVYRCYGGVNSLSKIYPGYTVQNEMTKTGLREELGLPSVYFYLAIFDALGDIKSQWTRTKSLVMKKISYNEKLLPEEKHFLRYLLKVNDAFTDVLNYRDMKLPDDLQKQYEKLAKDVNIKKAENYLRRQVRKNHVKLHSEKAYGFSLTERAYRYENHGIYITTKEKRKRIFIPLTDNNQYTRQIYIKLFPDEERIEIKSPVNVMVKTRNDYKEKVGVAVGMYTMFVTDQGHSYGEELGKYQEELTVWVREQTMKYHRNREQKPGRKKYKAKKRRMEEHIHSYINMEINRFLKAEKPEVIYIPKLPKPMKHGGNKEINYAVTMWKRGYIRRRLMQKCREQSINIVEVFGKDISNECSRCGFIGSSENGVFKCPDCGMEMEKKQNAAKNAKKRGMSEGS